jgi:hypothetical protein
MSETPVIAGDARSPGGAGLLQLDQQRSSSVEVTFPS